MGVQFTIRRTSLHYDTADDQPCETARKVGDDWAVDIDTLEQLLNMVRTEGAIIIGDPMGQDGDQFDIEIYDDYRE